ncbi:hypothetical protein C8A05DRAFT_35097 [Staphylotrichum tortipilum]|uniref:Uncharacterized protein n=1 Tax=Staphylotrichum tortipilum TaxID=2831512 RepID=A0AAN6MI05_9PEZI|nr:hypothetical protein C8A05DRAFT_35097 [Staphylotrichum longicolle]
MGNPNELKPDWGIEELHQPIRIQYSEDNENEKKPLLYVVGDSKLTQKWKSAWLGLPRSQTSVPMDLRYEVTERVVKTAKTERLLPLDQLATYCRYGQTCYGFIITQTELVALRGIQELHQPVLIKCREEGSEQEDKPLLYVVGDSKIRQK